MTRDHTKAEPLVSCYRNLLLTIFRNDIRHFSRREVSSLLISALILLCSRLPSEGETLVRNLPDSDNPPKLTLIRQLGARHFVVPPLGMQSTTDGVIWSPDGQVLATYARDRQVVEVWNSAGTLTHEIRRYGVNFLPPKVLGFLDGHKKLILAPSTLEEVDVTHLNQVMLTIIMPDTPNFLQDVPGNRPLASFRENQADILAISPDQTTAAIVYGNGDDDSRQVTIYSTKDWHALAVFRDTRISLPDFINSLAFSPDNKLLAAGRGYGRVQIYSLITANPSYSPD
jgi:WD40 repeat protein